MLKNLQKNADFQKKNVGVLDQDTFREKVSMAFYEPDADLAPFVAHYFIARWHFDKNDTYTAADVLAEPAIHLLFTENAEPQIIGVLSAKRTLSLNGTGCYAGVRFRSGAFYPFLHRDVNELAGQTIPASDVFSNSTDSFSTMLLQQEDTSIVEGLNDLLHAAHPICSAKVTLATAIAARIQSDTNLQDPLKIAQTYNISTRTLQQLFKTYVGVSVKWMIMRTRLIHAVEAAAKRDSVNWTTLAADLGYSTQSHFITDFKKVVGMSPTTYEQYLNKKKAVET